MSIERELLQTALGILEDYEWGYGGDHHKSPEASILNDIRKLLAQPEQGNTQYLLDQVSRLTAENAMLKEKWLSKGDDEDEYINEESGYNRSDWWE
ncbi:hypothetical protein UFOVP1516_2 [uncultured Caudovirales phage]|uniref:Uncharacterized protein n=1 Tax=uncultured Caudovirales phage TaxID=2100421 RepID=A0A6J7XA09_9CAUD|nr:hypothetical protein UFOVP887_42 [uncultured Caudovirales phage]CAB5226644.1 hypothetical protein UFOVP1516_2 [uncultured Caudovirales phage]